MKKLLWIFVFILFVSCTKDNPASSQVSEDDIELLGWMDIEYIVTAPSLPRIGRHTEPNHGVNTFLHTINNWSEIIAMPIRPGDRITLSVSLEAPAPRSIGTLKIKIIAKGIVIAEGESNASVHLTYIF